MKGSCDHTLNPGGVNRQIIQVGPAIVTIVWLWDGVSVYPACDGPVQSVSIENTGTRRWRFDLPRGEDAAARTIRVNAGATRTFTRQQCVNNGYADLSNVEDLLLSAD